MPQLQEIKGRIRAIGSLRKVTMAMELVTRTRINRVRQAAGNARAFEEQFRELYATVLASAGAERAAPDRGSPVRRYVVGFVSQKGFCGDFNNKVLAAIRNAFRTLEGAEGRRTLVGRRSAKAAQMLHAEFTSLECRERQYREQAAPLLAEIEAAILAGENVELYFVYNRFVSVLEQTPTTLRVYPAEAGGGVSPAGSPAAAGDTIFEPDLGTLSRALVGAYLQACFERAYWESIAGEACARLLAMKNANDNATLILDDLGILYNKTRQARITQELSEIVSAFDVLSLVQRRAREEGE